MPDTPNTAEPQKPRRPWFQFGLRTLLIGVVLIGSAFGYVAHEAQIVAARTDWRVRHPPYEHVHCHVNHIARRDPAADPTFVRRWLGDRPTEQIYLFEPSDGNPQEVAKLFPEASVMVPVQPFPEADIKMVESQR
jgi:hypothetical protein